VTGIGEKGRRIVILDSHRGGYLEDTSIEAGVLGSRVDVELVRVERVRDALEHLQGADVVISWHQIALARPDLESLRGCKGIVRASVGIDNIDLEAARELGIELCNVPDYGTEEVADHTFALLLAVVRNVLHVDGSVRSGEWRWQAIGTAPRLRGRRLGIVGLGRIGTAVAMRARAFGLRVAFFDPYVAAGTDKSLGLVRAASLDALLAESDILTLHVPLTPETRGLIGRDELALLPSGAAIVNTSRGEVVEQRALLEALHGEHLLGAGLDVLADEPAVPPELVAHPRVVLTAHSAFYSGEALAELRTKAAGAARRILEKQRSGIAREAPQLV
jgi:phosphoglycerate dehydrogenase-like enzyme